jgi:hypothetical protein
MAEIDDPEGKWEVGWDGHERAQLMRMANLPLSQKLLWLEEAEELVAHLQSQRKRLLSREPGAEETRREGNHE